MNLSELIIKANQEIETHGDNELMISVVFSNGNKLIAAIDNIKLINNGNHYEIRGEQT